jgi:hypothetical protein
MGGDVTLIDGIIWGSRSCDDFFFEIVGMREILEERVKGREG